jgi:hypothetical protein
MDVHAPHAPMHTWKDFWIHLGTITIGLLIAIGLEQSVEWMHRLHEKQVLQHDLREEAERNLKILSEDLRIAQNEVWMKQAMATTAAAKVDGGKLTISLALAPCYPGTLNTPHIKYFAPSETVWTAARESGLTSLIPAREARVYARLAHNQTLLSDARDRVAAACDEIAAMQQRLSTRQAGSADRSWTLTLEQAEKLAEEASQAEIATKALLFRLKTVQVCEEAILDDRLDYDKVIQMIGNVEAGDADDSPSAGQTAPGQL